MELQNEELKCLSNLRKQVISLVAQGKSLTMQELLYIGYQCILFSIMCKRLVVGLGHGKLRINKKYLNGTQGVG
jgi:hypothetical protein